MSDRRTPTGERPNPEDDDHAGGHAGGIRHRLLDEFRRFLLLFLYLWVIFGLFVLNERIILKQQGINYVAQGFALFNALVLAKVMLIAEDLNLGRWLDEHPLIYRIVHDSFLITVLFVLFHIIEKVIIGLVHGEPVAASVPLIGGGGIAGLLCVSAILFISLMPRFGFWSISRALGPGRMQRLLFGVRGHDLSVR